MEVVFHLITGIRRIHKNTHLVEPGSVLGLAADLFGAGTQGFCLGIRGYEFDDFGEALSTRAEVNLDAALEFTLDLLKTRQFEAAAE